MRSPGRAPRAARRAYPRGDRAALAYARACARTPERCALRGLMFSKPALRERACARALARALAPRVGQGRRAGRGGTGHAAGQVCLCPAGCSAVALSSSAPRLPAAASEQTRACVGSAWQPQARGAGRSGAAVAVVRAGHPHGGRPVALFSPLLHRFPRLCAEHAVYQLYQHPRRARASDVFERVWCIWLGVVVALCRAQLAAFSAPRSSRDGAPECPHASATAQRFMHVLAAHAARARAALCQ